MGPFLVAVYWGVQWCWWYNCVKYVRYLECGANDVHLSCVISWPGGVVLWWMHNIWMSRLSMRGSIRSSGDIVGSLYVMVSALKCVMMCETAKGPWWGWKLWYQLGLVVMSIVIVSGLFLAASRAQCRVCWVSCSVCAWAYPFPIHLCWNDVPIDPNTLSLGNGEENCRSEV